MTDRKNENIISNIEGIRSDIYDLKNTQPLGGASFINYSHQSNSQNDGSVVMNDVYKNIRLVFDHAEPGKYHLVDVSVFYRPNNANVMASPEVGDITTGRFVRVVREMPFHSYNSWIVTFVDFDQGFHPDYTYYYKFFFSGTTPGTFRIENL